MKLKFHHIAILSFALGAVSCKKDNYDAPENRFNGRIVYQGEPVNVEYNQVNLELWQPGFGRNGAINLLIDQNGNFSQQLFDGNYKLTIGGGQGPFIWPKNAAGVNDTIAISINGDQTKDIEVTPYYLVRNAQFAAANGNVTATFRVDKIITDANAKDIERISLYVNKTQFVSGANNINKVDLTITPTTDLTNLSASVSVPAMTPSQNYVFARIGLKVAGVEDMVFSPVSKVQL